MLQRVLRFIPRIARCVPICGGVCLGICLCVVGTGCRSNPATQGAYIGSSTSSGARSNEPRTSVPLFASQEVKADARNRAAMERFTGRPVTARPVSTDDVIGWKQAQVPDGNVVQQIRTHGAYRPMTSADLQTLQSRGVSNEVIRTLQEHPYPAVGSPAPEPTTLGSGRSYANAPPLNRTYDRGYGTTGTSTTTRPVLSGGGQPRVRRGYGCDGCGDCGSACGEYGECSTCPAEGYYIGEPVLLYDGAVEGCPCGG